MAKHCQRLFAKPFNHLVSETRGANTTRRNWKRHRCLQWRHSRRRYGYTRNNADTRKRTRGVKYNDMMGNISLSQVSLLPLGMPDASQTIWGNMNALCKVTDSDICDPSLLVATGADNYMGRMGTDSTGGFCNTSNTGDAKSSMGSSEVQTGAEFGNGDEIEPGEEGKRGTSRNVDVLSIPGPVWRFNNARETLTQGWSSARRRRYAIVQFETRKSVPLLDVMEWAENSPNMKSVLDVLQAYPVSLAEPFLMKYFPVGHWESANPEDFECDFAIPQNILKKMLRVISESPERPKNHGGELHLMLSIRNNLVPLSK